MYVFFFWVGGWGGGGSKVKLQVLILVLNTCLTPPSILNTEFPPYKIPI